MTCSIFQLFPKFPTLHPPVTTFSALLLLIWSATHLLFVTTLIPSMSDVYQLSHHMTMFSCLHLSKIADSLFNQMTTTLRCSIWSLTMLNSSFNAALQIPRSSPSPDRHNQHAGVTLLTQVPSKCQMAVQLQVPSIRFAQQQSSREVRLSCPLQHLTRD